MSNMNEHVNEVGGQPIVATTNRTTDFCPYDKKPDQPEDKKALSATNTSKLTPAKATLLKADEQKQTVPLDTGQSTKRQICNNCRGCHPTADCNRPSCTACRDNDMPFNHKQSDCPYRARKANAQANAARRRAREIAFLAFLAQYDDSEDSLYTDDFSDH